MKKLSQFLSKNRKIPTQVAVGGRHAGTYIDFEGGRELCRHFKLSEAPIDNAGLPGHNLNTAQTGAMEFFNNPLAEGQRPELVQESDHYSQLTELGSFLAPAKQSFLQLLNHAQ